VAVVCVTVLNHGISWNQSNFQAHSQNCEKCLLAPSCLSVRVSASKNMAPTGRIFMKFHIYLKFALEQATKAQGKERYKSTRSLAYALYGLDGQLHAPTALPPGETHCIGGWVDPKVGLDGCGKSRLQWDSIPGPPCPWLY